MIKIQEFEKKLKDLNIPYCLNLQEYDFKKIKYIVVGDNPGEREYKVNRYFVGPAGKVLRGILSGLLGIDESKLEEQVAFFNKTMIHTIHTVGLKEIRKNHREIFDQSQELCAEEILARASGDIKILIFGVNHIFKPFWETISKSNKVYSFHHPSRGMLVKQIKRGHIKNETQFLSFGAKEFQKNFRRICK